MRCQIKDIGAIIKRTVEKVYLDGTQDTLILTFTDNTFFAMSTSWDECMGMKVNYSPDFKFLNFPEELVCDRLQLLTRFERQGIIDERQRIREQEMRQRDSDEIERLKRKLAKLEARKRNGGQP